MRCMAWAGLVGLVCGCASAPAPPTASYPLTTTLQPTSGRCTNQTCRCRPLDAGREQGEDDIATGHRRFELRIPSSTSAVWVEIARQGVYYKAPNRVGATCFYVDLMPGEHTITLHAENRDAEVGLKAGLTVHEYAVAEGPAWYRSFHLACGAGASACTRTEMAAWKEFHDGLPRGVLDPCGSVMVRQVRFAGTRTHRTDDEYQTLTVRFTLKIYAFAPHQPPGSPECKPPVTNR
jgi:hypothetical protein